MIAFVTVATLDIATARGQQSSKIAYITKDYTGITGQAYIRDYSHVADPSSYRSISYITAN